MIIFAYHWITQLFACYLKLEMTTNITYCCSYCMSIECWSIFWLFALVFQSATSPFGFTPHHSHQHCFQVFPLKLVEIKTFPIQVKAEVSSSFLVSVDKNSIITFKHTVIRWSGRTLDFWTFPWLCILALKKKLKTLMDTFVIAGHFRERVFLLAVLQRQMYKVKIALSFVRWTQKRLQRTSNAAVYQLGV